MLVVTSSALVALLSLSSLVQCSPISSLSAIRNREHGVEARVQGEMVPISARVCNEGGPSYKDMKHHDGWTDDWYNAVLASLTHMDGGKSMMKRILDSYAQDAQPVSLEAISAQVWLSVLGVDGYEKKRIPVERTTDVQGEGGWWYDGITSALSAADPVLVQDLSGGKISEGDPHDILEMFVGHRGDVFAEPIIDVLRYHLPNAKTTPMVALVADPNENPKTAWEAVFGVAEGQTGGEKITTYSIVDGEKEHTYEDMLARTKKFIY